MRCLLFLYGVSSKAGPQRAKVCADTKVWQCEMPVVFVGYQSKWKGKAAIT